MRNDISTTKVHVAMAPEVSDAVGVPNRQWFIAIVNNNTEKTCETKLTKMGYEVYVPTQREVKKTPDGKRKEVDRILLSSLILMHITEQERKEVVALPFIHKFMTDRAGKEDRFHHHPIATIPHHQIEKLKFMLYHAEQPVSLEGRPIQLGDKVRVVRGNLTDLEGHVMTCEKGQTHLLVGMDILGYAKVSIDLADLEVIA